MTRVPKPGPLLGLARMSDQSSRAPFLLALFGLAVQFAAAAFSLTHERGDVSVADDFSQFVEQAQGRPYLVVSVIQNVTVTDEPPRAPVHRTVRERIVYTLMCLKEISGADGVFTEQITGNGARVTPWYGSSAESKTNVVQTNGYNVRVECSRGDFVSLETGANLEYDLPRPSEVSSLGGFMVAPFDVDHDFWGYPAEPDYIYRMTIVVESNVQLKTIPGGAKRRRENGDITSHDAVQQKQDRGAGVSTMSASWSKLTPSEQVALQWATAR